MRRVLIFTYDNGPERPPLVLAYLDTYFYVSRDGRECVHDVDVKDRRLAKAAAIAIHRRDCMGRSPSSKADLSPADPA